MIYTDEQVNIYLSKIGYNEKLELNGKVIKKVELKSNEEIDEALKKYFKIKQ